MSNIYQQKPNYLRHTLFASSSTVKAAAYDCLVRPTYIRICRLLLHGTCIQPETVTNWKQFSIELHAGHVVADGILKPVAGPNHLPHV